MGPFEKYITSIITFFNPLILVTVCQFFCVTSLVLFTKNKKTMEWEKKRFFVYMTASSYHVISKGKKIAFLEKIALLGTYVCINNPY